MSENRYEIKGTVGEWTFYEVTNHGFSGEFEGQPLYEFTTGELDKPRRLRSGSSELYPSLEHAMAAAIAEKYTGPRGAGGTGVGTAADWFMRMIGADQLVPLSGQDSRLILTGAAHVAGLVSGGGGSSALAAMDKALRDEGYTLAKVNR